MWWKRIKKKRIEAGILLYALFMSAVFSLLLQFYLNRQVAERQILLASQKRIQAYAQAQLAVDTWDRKEKTMTFSTGRVDLEEKSGFANVSSHLQDGTTYHFTFALSSSEKKKTDKKKKEKQAPDSATDLPTTREESSEEVFEKHSENS
ncbi:MULTISPECIES: competence type IV pilus minor pilin ComGG [unclassified Streptococcus]|uniref:competence type IV pilus minor pilin ComGG n=1 Tax=unclassified Streptococcus TaxID=2608887 RepID=UPI000F674676|nr:MULTISPECIES: competence type IV pilus minor pilin ComGG [unclassified Streptococcus]MCF4965182.1 hypothetical protein [Streptococcus sp. GS001]RSK05412.1 hypothetical protein D8782_04885 [Streptococcus sp. A12]